jgi:hypothetical protein
MQKLFYEKEEQKILPKDLDLDPLVENKNISQTKHIINPNFYSDFVYDLRKTRAQLEQSTERIIRLAKIAMAISIMKASQSKQNKKIKTINLKKRFKN